MDITLTAETVGVNGKLWRAATNGKEAIGKTAGEALDSLTMQLGKEQVGDADGKHRAVGGSWTV